MREQLLAVTMLANAALPASAQTPVWLCTPGPSGCSPAGTYSVSGTITGVGVGSTAAVSAVLGSASGRTTYICGFSVSALGGTAAVSPITVATLGGGATTLTWQMASATAGNTMTVAMQPCLPASTTNAAITVQTTADGSATSVDVNAWGFLQ